MGFEPLKRILRHTIATAPIAQELKIARVFSAWEDTLRSVWGAEKAAYVFVVSLREGTLTVDVSSPAAKQQLQTDLIRLQNETNRQLGEFLVRAIRARSRGF
ncbi:MAG: DUF721 domain-containing protein [Patescibacteria group bacterium]